MDWPPEDADTGELLDALRFVRVIFDDPVDIDEVHFTWTATMAIALGHAVIGAFRAAAAALNLTTEEEIRAHVSASLDRLITGLMITAPGDDLGS